MAHPSNKLSNSFEGALAGGGDPASSPLYVFGPFLKLIVVAGVAPVTFGASIWLVVLTVVIVSAMYRLVMGWVTDGSGGSGLSEEEFGGWAMKVNAGITVVEYTLTFLVSIAALVTFIADRYPSLDRAFFGISYRTTVAILLSLAVGWLVNRGPRMAARSFGPATLGVLLLLWAMVFAAVIKLGFHLPPLHAAAFRAGYLHFTLSGYARILALMTGIEVFANLVAAYGGTAYQRSRRAFGSLTIIMGTTLVTMLIVGPAIFQMSDSSDARVSVFTQTMDRLLPPPLPYLGTLVGVIVLGSAAAASAQGLQNLALGLRYRNYVPAFLGRTNRYEVADWPVWMEVGLASLCYLIFGTRDETYLTLYAAGVFVLLSMTGWAAAKRLTRELRKGISTERLAATGGAVVAALLTTGASAIIFVERFSEGVWAYLFFIPVLYTVFGFTRSRLGAPTPLDDHLGRFYSGQYLLPYQRYGRPEHDTDFDSIVVALDGSALAEHSLPVAQLLSKTFGSTVRLIALGDSQAAGTPELTAYIENMTWQLNHAGVPAAIGDGSKLDRTTLERLANLDNASLIILTAQTRPLLDRWLHPGPGQTVREITSPLLLLRPTDGWRSRTTQFRLLLVCLDGSETAEQVLRYARTLANRFRSELLLLAVPEAEAESARLRDYLGSVADALRGRGLNARVLVTGSGPARTVVEVAGSEQVDLIVIASSGRGGASRRSGIGTVAEEMMQTTPCPLLVVPVQ
jgi:nucleotide-binding universal stress UspA family protein